MKEIKKVEVLENLEKLKFPKLSTKVDALESEKTYNYITDMPLFSLTEEKINELNDEYQKKLKELDIYKNTTLEDLWKTELDEFIVVYKKWISDLESVEKSNNKEKIKISKKGKKSKNKKVKIKTK